MADNLYVLLAMVRAEMPEVPDEAWEKIKRIIGARAGGDRVYVPMQKKRSQLEILSDVGDQASTAQVSKLLGVSVRRVQQLKRLR
jgi:hypothetical protein